MPLRLLIGSDATPTYSEAANQSMVNQLTPALAGIGKELRIYSHLGAGNGVKAHINDSNGDLLTDFGGAKSLSSTGWNAFSISDLEIVDASYYLGFNPEVNYDVGGYENTPNPTEYYVYSSYSGFVAPDPISLTGYSSYPNYILCIAVWGYIPPTISGDNKSGSIAYNETGVTLSGVDFEGAQGTGTVYLSDNATWGAGTVVEQTGATAWADGSVTFDVTPGALGSGTVYAWIETDSGQHNATGYSMLFTAASGDVDATGAGQSPTVDQGTGSASAPVGVTGAGQSPTIGQGTGSAQVGSDVEATGAGQSPTIGLGTAAAQAGVSTGPAAEYLFNEAASGTGTGTVEDQRQNAADLTITYDSSEPVYDTDTGGRLLDFGNDKTAYARLRATHGPVTTGHKVHTALHGSKKVTWELVYRLPQSQNLDARRGAPLLMACQKDFEGIENGFYIYSSHYDVNSKDTLQVSFNTIGTVDYHTDPTTFYEHYFNRNVKLESAPPYGGGTNENFYSTSERTIVAHFVIDTTQTNAIDRIQLWIDGVRYALNSWNGYDHPTEPEFHGGQDVPLNAEIHLTPFSSGSGDYEVQIGVGCAAYPNGGTPRGQVGYGAVYDRAMGATEIGARATALAADHDSAWVGAVDVTGAGQTPTVDQGTGSAAIPVEVTGAGQAPTVDQGTGSAAIPVEVTGAGQEVGEEQEEGSAEIPVEVAGAGQTPTVEGGNADAEVGADIDTAGAGQTPTVAQGTGSASVPVEVAGAGQTVSTDQGDAGATAPIDVTGAGQTASVTPGSAAAQAGGVVAAVGEGQTPTVDQGTASLPVNATGAGQTASTDQGDAGATAPIDATGAGQTASTDQGDAGVSISGPVDATGAGQAPTVDQGTASASIRDSVWGNVSEIDGVAVQNIESIMGIASQNIGEIDGVAV